MKRSRGAGIDFAQHRAPIYAQLATLFRRFIVTGQWAVEQRIPTHEELAAQFEVNPATIRKTIGMLEAEGLLKAMRRRGTVVVAKPVPPQWLQIPTQWKHALTMFEGMVPEFLGAEDVRQLLEVQHAYDSRSPVYRRIRRLYRRAGQPVAVEDAYLDPALRPQIGDARLRRGHLLQSLEQCQGLRIDRVDQTIRFGIASGEVGAMLELPLNAPVAMVRVTALGPGRRLHCEVQNTIRGDMVRVAEPIAFSRSK